MARKLEALSRTSIFVCRDAHARTREGGGEAHTRIRYIRFFISISFSILKYEWRNSAFSPFAKLHNIIYII